MNAEVLLFWVFAVCTVGSAALVIAARNAIHSAMALVGTFFFLAGIYVLLWAHTIAVMQVLVYAGAIMVLFLFVIMLLSLSDVPEAKRELKWSKLAGGGAAAALLVLLLIGLSKTPSVGAIFGAEQQASFGSLEQMGQLIYTSYLFPFEAVSLLLLVAIVGAVVVAKSRI